MIKIVHSSEGKETDNYPTISLAGIGEKHTAMEEMMVLINHPLCPDAVGRGDTILVARLARGQTPFPV